MNYRTFALAGVALIGAAAAAFLAFAPPQPRGPRLIPVEPPAAYAPAPGEFGGRIGPVKLAEPPEAAPDLKFADASGRDIALAAFRGRAIVVNLWATWCVPCVEELPALDRLQAKLGGPGFEVVALAVDREGHALVDPFLDKLAIKSLARYFDTGNLATRTFKARGLPTTMLIDAEGREIGRLVGAAAWDSPEAEAYLRRVLKIGGAG